MHDFEFTAKEIGTGRVVRGSLQSESQVNAARMLSDKNLYVTHLAVKSSEKKGLLSASGFHIGGVRTKDKVLFTRQLSTLVHASLPITQALNTAIEQVNDKHFKQMLQNIAAGVEGGAGLAASFANYPETFNRTYISLLNAGEQSGTLDKTLDRLATQLEKEHAIVTKVRGAMVYPAIILAVIVGVMIFMLVTVLPQIKSLYASLNVTLPILTRIFLGVSNFVQGFWWLIILAVIAAIFGLRAYIRTPSGRYHLDKLKLDIPPLNVLFRKVYMSRFTRTLGVLVVSGVPILEALAISADSIGNDVLKREVIDAAGEVKGGKPLSGVLAGYPYFTTLVPQMIRIGEDSGTLGDMLDKVAIYYEDEVDSAVKNLSTLIEPFLIIVMGALVGVIIMAVLYPVYSLVGNGINNIGNVQNSSSSATSGSAGK